MTWRNWGWFGGYRWFLIAITAFILVMLTVLYLDSETPVFVKGIVTVVLLASLVLVFVAHPWVTVNPGEVRIGYFPLYRRTLPLRDVRNLSIVTVDPLRKYSGYGVRGLAKSRRGLLLGGHPPTALRFETVDDRRYIVTLRNLEPVVNELARYGCTLSAGNSDESSQEV